MNESKVYARLDESGNILEYPVYESHIRNRHHPQEWYTECRLDQMPIVPRFYVVKENLQVLSTSTRTGVKRTVVVSYEILPQQLNNLLHSVSKNAIGEPSTVSDLDEETVAMVIKLADEYVEAKLDAFAQTRGYKNAERCAGYKDSTIPKFSTEAATVIALRDQVWLNLPNYMTGVLTGANPFPRSTLDIDSQLPQFVW